MKRVIDFLTTAARQAVPVGGIFALGWQPPVAIAVYWVESVLLVAFAAMLCVRLRDSTSAADARAAGVHPRDVLVFHWGSMAIFGAFFAMLLLMLTLTGRIPPVDWTELQYATGGMALALALGFAFDTLLLPAPSVAAVRSRVDACLGRWMLMWLLGFGGTVAMMISGRPETFFRVFAGLKVTWEAWGLMARTFGWKSLNEQALDSRAAR